MLDGETTAWFGFELWKPSHTIPKPWYTDPASTLVRPDLRIQIGSPTLETYNKPLKHDDVVIVPELFGKEDDWSIYYKLVDELRELQQKEQSENKDNDNEKEQVQQACPIYH